MPESKKIVIKVDVHDNKGRKKALQAVSSLCGIESIAMDMKDQKLTVIGAVDPVDIIGKLKKLSHTEILTVGPAKEKNDEKVPQPQPQPQLQPHYYVHCVEEKPNSCFLW